MDNGSGLFPTGERGGLLRTVSASLASRLHFTVYQSRCTVPDLATVLELAMWLLIAAGLLVVGRAFVRFSCEESHQICKLIRQHFHPVTQKGITISTRQFPHHMRADLQRALDQFLASDIAVVGFCGVAGRHSYTDCDLTTCMTDSSMITVSPEYEDLEVGDAAPVRCLKIGLWRLRDGTKKTVLLLSPFGHFGEIKGVQVQIAAVNTPEGVDFATRLFKHLEDALARSVTYRGKILSLEKSEHDYSGRSSGVKVHKLRMVERDQVILPEKTVALLDRNVIQFVKQRPQLAKYRQATRKGILMYGPPGTGKTLTIHYLAKALAGHTTLLISADQVGLLSEYMTLARLLQPSIVVMEDADLIARERTSMNSVCEELLLNRLLNEMDGLHEEADILFILTTNRPESLERALASRPGRIDQAIEFPLPDEQGRKKLVRLYSPGLEISDEVLRNIVQRTDKVSAAFIKELMRRAVQFHLERKADGVIALADIDLALDEMLFSGGTLNLKLLGADSRVAAGTT